MSDFGIVVETDAVRLERVLPGPIERVWEYLTDSEKRGEWLAPGSMDLRIGGRVELHFHHADLTPHAEEIPEKYKSMEKGRVLIGAVTRCEPPRLLSYTWGEPSNSEVTFELTPQGENVLLVLTHRKLGDRKTMISVAGGWHTHVGILIDKLNGRTPPPFWATHAQFAKEYERRFSVAES